MSTASVLLRPSFPLSGVVDVQVDAASGRVLLAHEVPLDLNAVESAVEDAGYTVRSWTTATNA
ncbi:MAG: heavy-metal-associated domain-containing protein [Brachybacterium tyrofermentans]